MGCVSYVVIQCGGVKVGEGKGRVESVDNCEQQLEFFTKAMVRPRTRADHGHSRGN